MQIRNPVILAIGAALLLMGCAAAPRGDRLRDRPLSPDHGAVVAAQLALNREAGVKGHWMALRDAAHRDAMILVPARVRASDWLRTQTGGATAMRWEPYQLALSCDGMAAAVSGAMVAPNGDGGSFVTIWLRDSRGRLAWVLHSQSTVPMPGPAPDYIDGKKAKCGTRPGVQLSAGAEGDDVAVGLAPDQTLSWTSTVGRDGDRRIVVRMWDGTAMQPVIDTAVPRPPLAGG